MQPIDEARGTARHSAAPAAAAAPRGPVNSEDVGCSWLSMARLILLSYMRSRAALPSLGSAQLRTAMQQEHCCQRGGRDAASLC